MTAQPPRFTSYRAALAEALETLDLIRDKSTCSYGDDGRCTHSGAGEEFCPHLDARHLMADLVRELPPSPYTPTTLLAVLRGLSVGEEAVLTFSAHGHTHTGSLRGRVSPPGEPPQFWAESTCGSTHEPLDPADIITLDVVFTGILGRDMTPEDMAEIERQMREKGDG